MSLAERRPRRINRQLPKRFRDIIPQPLSLLPPTVNLASTAPSILPSPTPVPNICSPESSSLGSRICRVFQTPRNIFGLFRRYSSENLPSHDPEERVHLHDLSDDSVAVVDGTSAQSQNIPTSSNINSAPNPFRPYPNKNSFLLGDWYWNRGLQKSTDSFKSLLHIVADEQFRPEDVRHTQWGKINAQLAKTDFDGDGATDGEGLEWLDEDAGWMRTPINISVPFHRRAKKPGPQTYVVGDLYHRSLVAVIREKLAQPQDDQLFHYDPFELFWKSPNSSANLRVHGELYTSPAFLDAHRELQDSPREPGCDLPKVIVAMMFSSDATQLTAFGNAKLWPCYLYFGNESKYRRCKPTNHLCNHVAYFQAVSWCFLLATFSMCSFDTATGRIQRLRY
jgi:hypothetical protein